MDRPAHPRSDGGSSTPGMAPPLPYYNAPLGAGLGASGADMYGAAHLAAPPRAPYQLPHPAHRPPPAAAAPFAAYQPITPESGLDSPGPSHGGEPGSRPSSPPPAKRARKKTRTGESGASDSADADEAPATAESKEAKHGPRVGKACLPCSSKKRRCDGGRPECKVCLVLGTQCSYNASGLKRGPPKGFRSTPKESAKAKIMRTLETTIRDLATHLGPEAAATELARISNERGVTVSMPESGEAKEGLAGSSRQRSLEGDEDRDGDFLGINEKGEVSHRGSSSGIQLLHRQQSSVHSPLGQHASTDAGTSGEEKRTVVTPAVLPLPLIRPAHQSDEAGAGEGEKFTLSSELPLSNGAQAHRDHILNTLSPQGTPRTRDRTLDGHAPSPLKASADLDDDAEATALRSSLMAVRRQSLAIAEPILETPAVSEAANARLWRFYWSGFHPFWPILFKPALDEIPVAELPDRLDGVLLYAVYAIAACVGAPPASGSSTLQTALDPALADELGESIGEIFARRSEQHLYASRLRPCVSTIQAAFLLALYHHGQGDLSRAWTFSSLSQSLSMDLGFHRWPIHRLDLLSHSTERETRVRLIHHVRILGTLLSAEMGRPVLMHAKDCDVPLLSEKEKDEFELWDDQVEMQPGGAPPPSANGKPRYLHAPSTLNEGVRLFNIIESILSSVHSFRRKAALRKQGNAKTVLADLDRQLSKWKEDLPTHLRFEGPDNSGEGGPLPSFFALNVWYYNAILLLHRPFIPQDEGAKLSEVLSNDSHRKCTAAANKLCDLLEPTSVDVDRLSGDLGYCLFSASLLFLFNASLSDKDISDDAKRRFLLCRQWLKKLSARWPAASAHKQLLDGVAMVGEGFMCGREDASGASHAKEGRAGTRAQKKGKKGQQKPRANEQAAEGDNAAHGTAQDVSPSAHGKADRRGWEQPSSAMKSWELSNERGGTTDGSYAASTTSASTEASPDTQHAFRARAPPLLMNEDVNMMAPEQVQQLASQQQGARALNNQPRPGFGVPPAMQMQQQQPQMQYQAQQQMPQQSGFGGFPTSAEQQRQLVEYLQSSSAYGGASAPEGFYSHAPSLFDAESVFWNETAGRRDDGGVAAALGMQQRGYPVSEPPTGLAMLAHVTAGSSGQAQSLTPQQQQQAQHQQQLSSAAAQYFQQHSSFSGGAAEQPAPAQQNLRAPPHNPASVSPFGFQLDPSQPTWSDVMSMLQLPPAFSGDGRESAAAPLQQQPCGDERPSSVQPSS